MRNRAAETFDVTDEIDHARRRCFGIAALTFATAELGFLGRADASPAKASPPNMTTIERRRTVRGSTQSFGHVKQIVAGVLEVGYVEVGPAGGPAVNLLHGWPYDIHTYADVAPLLASAECRVVVPYLRAYGTTRFTTPATLPAMVSRPRSPSTSSL